VNKYPLERVKEGSYSKQKREIVDTDVSSAYGRIQKNGESFVKMIPPK
jgi:hypothetical protein